MINPRTLGRGHLKLVHDRTQKEIEWPNRQLQMMLPLSMPHNILVSDVRGYRYHNLESVIAFVQPRWIFDFRKISRFDILAGSRNHAFRLFRQHGAGYADIIGMFRRGLPFKEMTRISLWQRVLKSVIIRDDRFRGPILVITEDIDEFSKLSYFFVSALNRATKQDYGISILQSNLLESSIDDLREVM